MVEQMRDPDFTAGANRAELARQLDYIADGSTVEATRVEIELRMRAWVEDNDPDPSLTVRCSSPYRGKPCRRLIARVWTVTPYRLPDDAGNGHYFRAESRTAQAVRIGRTVEVMAIREAGGMPHAAAVAEQAVDAVSTAYDGCVEHPLPGLDGGVLLGCPKHGRVAVHGLYLARLADSPRRVLNVPTDDKYVGYP